MQPGEAAAEVARVAGLLEECQCCYSTDCVREDITQCKSGHCYCKECVARGASVAIGDGKTIIECLGHCREEIGWKELQKALAPNILSKLLQRRQAEEVGQGCRICGSVVALLPGTFYFPRPFFLDEKGSRL